MHLDTPGTELAARARTLVKSPGVPREAPVVAAARERGRGVIGELELGLAADPHNEFMAVTGTNGKTTTTELIGHIHREAGLPVAVAGNVGTAVASLADTIAATRPSSARRRRSSSRTPRPSRRRRPCCSTSSPDHLDRHGTLDAYTRAKLQVFRRQGNDDVAVAPVRPGRRGPRRLRAARLLRHGPGRRARRPRRPAVVGRRAADRDGRDPPARPAQPRQRDGRRRGDARARRDADAVRAALRSFAGVPHRLEEVAERDGVLYVNDSKATNVAEHARGAARPSPAAST